MTTIFIHWRDIYRQPSGALIELGWGSMQNATTERMRYFAVRIVNKSPAPELWNGWPLLTIARILDDWRAFEARIGSTRIRGVTP